MSTKKAFLPIVEFLENNKDKKVSTILDEVKTMTAAKVGGGGRASETVLRDKDGNVTHVFCYYHKMWEDVKVAEYGKKASSSTGLNSMCKEGTSAWTKQQREAKTAREELLEKVGSGEVAPGDIKARTEEIEKNRAKIIPREDGHGTKEAPGGTPKKDAA